MINRVLCSYVWGFILLQIKAEPVLSRVNWNILVFTRIVWKTSVFRYAEGVKP